MRGCLVKTHMYEVERNPGYQECRPPFRGLFKRLFRAPREKMLEARSVRQRTVLREQGFVRGRHGYGGSFFETVGYFAFGEMYPAETF